MELLGRSATCCGAKPYSCQTRLLTTFTARSAPFHLVAASGARFEWGAVRCKLLVGGVVDQLGRIDILINNGGGQFFSPAQFITPNGFDAVVATNLTGTWNVTQAVANRWMIENGGGRIINITMNTNRGFPGMAHSVAARAGVEGMTRTLAIEWAFANIQVNCIQPGVIASSGLRNYPDAETMVRTAQTQIPAKRLGTVDEIAWSIAWLASPAGAYVTGQTITVDGGRSLWGETWPIPDPEPMPEWSIPVEPWEENT